MSGIRCQVSGCETRIAENAESPDPAPTAGCATPRANGFVSFFLRFGLVLRSSLAPRAALDFGEAVAGAGVEIEGVEFFQVVNALERGRTKGSLAVEGVEHDAFEQIAQGHVVIFGEGFEDFEQAFFHADAGLYTFDEKLRFIDHGTNVPWYQNNSKRHLTRETWQGERLRRANRKANATCAPSFIIEAQSGRSAAW